MEGLLSNWGVVGNSESDIAIEEFDPYDSHYIYEILLSVFKYNKRNKGNKFFKAMFNEMWPELLKFPFNPPDKFSDKIKTLIRAIGIFNILKKQINKIDYWRYKRFVDK